MIRFSPTVGGIFFKKSPTLGDVSSPTTSVYCAYKFEAMMINKNPDTFQVPIYRIKIHGILDNKWRSWLKYVELTTECDSNNNQITVLEGPVVDQSELRGLMMKIWDLNLTLISITKVENKSMKG